MSVLPTIAGELVELVDASPAPVYLVDDRRRIVYCNASCCTWLGLKPAELLGQQCVYHTRAESVGADAASSALCPPPKAFCGQHQEAVVAWPTAVGAVKYRAARFLALDDGDDESSPVLVILDRADCTAPPLTEAADVPQSDAELHERLQRMRHQLAGRYRADSLLGVSPAIVRVRAQVELAAHSGTPVLIVGPPGAGKDHAAKAIHYGQTRSGALMPLSCTVLDTNLLRSTLRAARLRVAGGNTSATLLLEDIEALAPEAQADLLEILRADAARLRVIGTSTKSLAELAKVEGLSPALVCAISTVTIEIPALAQRLEDLPLLAQAFLEEANVGATKQLGGFSTETLDRLAGYGWPGNVDELALLVREMHERAVAGEATPADLPPQLKRAADAAAHPTKASDAIVLEEFLAQVERELISRALRRANGNKSKAAKLLGLTRPRLYRRLVQLGLENPSSPPPAGN